MMPTARHGEMRVGEQVMGSPGRRVRGGRGSAGSSPIVLPSAIGVLGRAAKRVLIAECSG